MGIHVSIQDIAQEALHTRVLRLDREAQLQSILWEHGWPKQADVHTDLLRLIVAVRSGTVRKVSRAFCFSDAGETKNSRAFS